jgi:hypothetical protein
MDMNLELANSVVAWDPWLLTLETLSLLPFSGRRLLCFIIFLLDWSIVLFGLIRIYVCRP